MTTSNRPSAKTTWSLGQRILMLLLACTAVAITIADAKLALWALDLCLLGGFALVVTVKLASIISGLLFHDMEDPTADEVAALDDDELPIYTILVPMYKEPEMVAHMVDGLGRMDYPKDKLDVQLLLEADDEATQEAAAALNIPPWVSVVVVPEGKPKTKPRACNFGLAQAKGEFLVIFDAEDRPEPDQLKKAVATFRRLPQVSCLQACLNYYNAQQNTLTRWFTLEYTTWFDLFLPGLHSLRAPIPLGGTSNHFRTDVLSRLGGWDAWNVTEDCDLGLEMARERLETRILNSTTWEEAVSNVPIWLGQRSRWVKGYWQTLLVHTRQPIRGLREFGAWRYLMVWLIVGGHVFALALQPFCWLRLIIGAMNDQSIFHPTSPHTVYLYVAAVLLGASNVIFILVHAVAVWQRGLTRLWPAALGLPIYWALMSWAAWKGVLQHIWAPFLWEKTKHGMATEQSDQANWQPSQQLAENSQAKRSTSLIILAVAIAVITLLAIQLPRLLNFDQQIAVATLGYDTPAAQVEISVEENWQKKDAVTFRVKLPRSAKEKSNVFKAIVHLKVGEGTWYQQHTANCVRNGNTVSITTSLTDNWQAEGAPQPFGPWCLRRVRAAGLKLYTHDSKVTTIQFTDLELAPTATPEPPFQATMLTTAKSAEQNTMFEQRFTLSRTYKNPFDPRQIDVFMEIVAPSGKTDQQVAFYFQEYERSYKNRAEILTALETPEWRVRYTPREAGTYKWRLAGKDHSGDRITMPWQICEVRTSDALGFIRVDPKDHNFFSYESDKFFFPLGINLRSPTDNYVPPDRDYKMPSAAAGTKIMNQYVDQMAASGMNLARIWMAPWFGGIEWHKSVPGYNGLGQYNLKNARQLDWILDNARSHGIVVDLALQNHGPFASTYDKQWEDNPYNSKHGGPLRNRRNVMTDPESKRLFAQRFRYIAARWGADPAIFGWTVWIEVDAVRASYSKVRQWHREMIPALRKYDTGRHPVSTMYAGNEGDELMWKMDEIDFTQIAAYSEYAGAVERFEEVADYLNQFDKPAIIEEYGGSAVMGNMNLMAQHIHDGLWAGLMQDVAGAPYPWWWNFVFAKNLGRFHKTAANFIGDTDLRGRDWHCYNTSLMTRGQQNFRAAVRQADDLAWAWVYEDAQTSLRARSRERGYGMDWRRILRAQNRAYAEYVGTRYNPVSTTKPDRFDTVKNATLTLQDMRPGTYTIEFWETWGSNKMTQTTATVGTNGRLEINIPPTQQDLAIRAVFSK